MAYSQKTELTKLLERIDGKIAIQEINHRMDKALNSFSYGSGKIINQQEFEEYMARFYCHIENTSLNNKRPVNLKFDYQRCYRIFIDEYGPKGEHLAFEMAISGIDGGLYGLLKIVASKTAAQYSRNTIRSHINEFFGGGMPYQKMMAVAEEYKGRFGRYLPAKYSQGSVALIAADLFKILEEHPFIIHRMRQIGQ